MGKTKKPKSNEPSKKEKSAIGALAALVDKQQAEEGKNPTVSTLLQNNSDLQKPLNEVIVHQAEPLQIKEKTVQEKKEKFAAFGKWLQLHAPESFYNDRFRFDVSVEEGTGVVAEQDLPVDKHFMSIPRSVMLSTETMAKSPVGSVLAGDRLCQNMPSLALAVHLYFEVTNPQSFWRPYLDILPASFSLPLYFNTQQLELLQGSSTQLEALKLQKATVRQYLHLHKLLLKSAGNLGLPPFHFLLFRWCVSIIMTRQNRIPSKSDPANMAIALIPGWDCCNHRSGKMATFFNPDADASESFTMEEVKRGQPIYLYYGDRSNAKLFMYMGFVHSGNANDSLDLVFGLKQDDPLTKLKQLMVMQRKLGSFSLPVPEGEAAARASALAVMLRVACLDKEQATAVLKGTSDPGEPVSAANEEKAWEYLQEVLSNKLQTYAAEAGGDENTANEGKQGDTDSTAFADLARQMVACEKKLITDAIARCEELKKLPQ